jgi:hypothetical protein
MFVVRALERGKWPAIGESDMFMSLKVVALVAGCMLINSVTSDQEPSANIQSFASLESTLSLKRPPTRIRRNASRATFVSSRTCYRSVIAAAHPVASFPLSSEQQANVREGYSPVDARSSSRL